MWIVCLLSFAVFLKFKGLERLEKFGIIKIIGSSFIFQKKNLNENYMEIENWNLKSGFQVRAQQYWAIN